MKTEFIIQKLKRLESKQISGYLEGCNYECRCKTELYFNTIL